MLSRISIIFVPLVILGKEVTIAESHKNGPGFQVPAPLRWALEKTEFDIWSLYLPTEVDPNSTCHAALEDLENDFTNNELTGAYKLFDSWGKSSTGYLVGMPFYRGVYDECKSTRFHEETVGGRFCKISLKTFLTVAEETREVEKWWLPLGVPHETQGEIIDILNGGQKNGTVVTYSTCIPDVCNREDLEASLIEILNNTDLSVQTVDCHFDFTSDSFSAGDIGFIVLMSFFGIVLLVASLVDIYIQKTDNQQLAKGGLRYLLPFSAYTNIEKMFHINTTSPPGTITCLHGLRVLSMTWVVYAHQTMTTFIYTSNIYSMFSHMRGILYQTLLNGYPSVDTFFFMSGFLMTYSVLREFKRSGRFNIFLFYFHRFLRLIPPIALVCGFYATVPLYFMEGPIANWAALGRQNCQESWWRDVIFIDNFAPLTGDTVCLGQCWYLAVDTQFYLIAPLILLPLMHRRSLGMVWLSFITVMSIVIPSVITYVNELPPTSLMLDPKGTDEFNLVYSMPWCRAGPILVGMWLGVFIQEQGKDKIKLQPWQVLTGWTIAACSGLLVVYGVWSYNIFPKKENYDVMTAVTYAGLHRPAWAAAVAWVVFACYNGYGGFVDDFLSHPIWQPISRLTYAIYLVALSLQSLINQSTRIPFYYTHYAKVIETVGALLMSVIPAILVSITVESPIIGIEKLIFRRPSREESGANKEKEQSGVNNEAFVEIKELNGKIPDSEVYTKITKL